MRIDVAEHPSAKSGAACIQRTILYIYTIHTIPQRQLTGRAVEWRCTSLPCYGATSAIMAAYRVQAPVESLTTIDLVF